MNLSIDVDYATCNLPHSAALSNYDDIDSYAEYIIEKIEHNDNLISEDDDDSGCSSGKSLEKYSTDFFYFEQFSKPRIFYSISPSSSWFAGIDQANKTCKGFYNIISPPPKA